MSFDYLDRSLNPELSDARSWKRRGDAHLAGGNNRDAVAAYEQAILLQPGYGEVYNPLGLAWLNLGDQTRGVAYWEVGLRVKPNSPDIANNLGIVFSEKEDLDQAAHYFRLALRLQPDYPDASNSLGMILKEQGLLEEARAQFLETLKIKPDHAQAIYQLSELAAEDRHQFSIQDLQRIKGYLASGRYDKLERSLYHFTLAAVYNKQGSHDEAFGHYREANELRYALLRESNKAFNAQKHQTLINYLIAHENQAYFEKVLGWGLDAVSPIFIVGMPRSGSTLVEQILASHPLVFGAGELGEVPRLVMGLAREAKTEHLLPNQQVTRERADSLVQLLNNLSKGAPRVTTKTLDNYLHLGVIATMFPRARIIHCRRDPLDVCLSCYFHNFQELAFSFSLEDIGAFYRLYEKLMSHWAQVLPMPIHDVRYEDLVQNQEAVSRRLLAFCGLDWDDRCLNFHKTNRPVRTASSIQVRKPISAHSIGRWKHYRAHLGPLFQALGPIRPYTELPASQPVLHAA